MNEYVKTVDVARQLNLPTDVVLRRAEALINNFAGSGLDALRGLATGTKYLPDSGVQSVLSARLAALLLHQGDK